MAKKFAEITGIHKIFNPVTISSGPNAGTTIYQGMTITDSELKKNIDENTIVFVTADDTDIDRIIGPNNYKISKDDCFIIAQNKVYATFGKVNVSDVMGPTGEKGENGAGSVSDLIGLNDNQYTTDIVSTVSLIEGDYGISKEGNVWVYDGSSLINSGVNLKGPKGNTGEPGAQGTAGETSGGTTEIKDSLPIGAITMYAGEKIPDGWLLCNGASINIKSVSTINIPGHGPDTDGEELFTTDFNETEIKWQIANKDLNYLCDLLKIIKSNYGIETPRTQP